MKVYGIEIPTDKGLTNFQLTDYAERLQIPNFRGVFMKNSLPSRVTSTECGIVNLDSSNDIRSHWVCYVKLGKIVSTLTHSGRLYQSRFLDILNLLVNFISLSFPKIQTLCKELIRMFVDKYVQLY